LGLNSVNTAQIQAPNLITLWIGRNAGIWAILEHPTFSHVSAEVHNSVKAVEKIELDLFEIAG
jgi:hypothetical protein